MTARLFAALDLPADVRARLVAFGRAAAAADPALRAVGDDALHVTLAFLGHRPLDDVAPASAAVGAAAGAEPVALELGGPLWLAPRRPHVLSVALRDRDGALGRLQAAVVERLAAALDWTPDRRSFRPHVTVARVRRGPRPRRDALPDAPTGAFVARSLALYRSHLGGGPARYEALASVVLG